MTNHAQEAEKHIEYVHEWQSYVGDTDETNLANALVAQVHATLALAEQQRISNLIALANSHHASEAYDDVEEARRQAAYSLIAYKEFDPDTEYPILNPKIAAALGIGEPA